LKKKDQVEKTSLLTAQNKLQKVVIINTLVEEEKRKDK